MNISTVIKQLKDSSSDDTATSAPINLSVSENKSTAIGNITELKSSIDSLRSELSNYFSITNRNLSRLVQIQEMEKKEIGKIEPIETASKEGTKKEDKPDEKENFLSFSKILGFGAIAAGIFTIIKNFDTIKKSFDEFSKIDIFNELKKKINSFTKSSIFDENNQNGGIKKGYITKLQEELEKIFGKISKNIDQEGFFGGIKKTFQDHFKDFFTDLKTKLENFNLNDFIENFKKSTKEKIDSFSIKGMFDSISEKIGKFLTDVTGIDYNKAVSNITKQVEKFTNEFWKDVKYRIEQVKTISFEIFNTAGSLVNDVKNFLNILKWIFDPKIGTFSKLEFLTQLSIGRSVDQAISAMEKEFFDLDIPERGKEYKGINIPQQKTNEQMAWMETSQGKELINKLKQKEYELKTFQPNQPSDVPSDIAKIDDLKTEISDLKTEISKHIDINDPLINSILESSEENNKKTDENTKAIDQNTQALNSKSYGQTASPISPEIQISEEGTSAHPYEEAESEEENEPNIKESAIPIPSKPDNGGWTEESHKFGKGNITSVEGYENFSKLKSTNLQGVDEDLLKALDETAKNFEGYGVVAISGKRNTTVNGNQSRHNFGEAIDINLVDENGKILENENIKNLKSYKNKPLYEAFANRMRQYYIDHNIKKPFAWGGHFKTSTPRDDMHLSTAKSEANAMPDEWKKGLYQPNKFEDIKNGIIEGGKDLKQKIIDGIDPKLIPRSDVEFYNKPSKFDDLFEKYTKQYNLPPNLLRATSFVESSFDPSKVSPKGGKGLMQFIDKTAGRYNIDPLNPEQAIEGAAKYYQDILKKFNGDVKKAIAAYNSGEFHKAYEKSDWRQHIPHESEKQLEKVSALMGIENTGFPGAKQWAGETYNLDNLKKLFNMEEMKKNLKNLLGDKNFEALSSILDKAGTFLGGLKEGASDYIDMFKESPFGTEIIQMAGKIKDLFTGKFDFKEIKDIPGKMEGLFDPFKEILGGDAFEGFTDGMMEHAKANPVLGQFFDVYDKYNETKGFFEDRENRTELKNQMGPLADLLFRIMDVGQDQISSKPIEKILKSQLDKFTPNLSNILPEAANQPIMPSLASQPIFMPQSISSPNMSSQQNAPIGLDYAVRDDDSPFMKMQWDCLKYTVV